MRLRYLSTLVLAVTLAACSPTPSPVSSLVPASAATLTDGARLWCAGHEDSFLDASSMLFGHRVTVDQSLRMLTDSTMGIKALWESWYPGEYQRTCQAAYDAR